MREAQRDTGRQADSFVAEAQTEDDEKLSKKRVRKLKIKHSNVAAE